MRLLGSGTFKYVFRFQQQTQLYTPKVLSGATKTQRCVKVSAISWLYCAVIGPFLAGTRLTWYSGSCGDIPDSKNWVFDFPFQAHRFTKQLLLHRCQRFSWTYSSNSLNEVCQVILAVAICQTNRVNGKVKNRICNLNHGRIMSACGGENQKWCFCFSHDPLPHVAAAAQVHHLPFPLLPLPSPRAPLSPRLTRWHPLSSWSPECLVTRWLEPRMRATRVWQCLRRVKAAQRWRQWARGDSWHTLGLVCNVTPLAKEVVSV